MFILISFIQSDTSTAERAGEALGRLFGQMTFFALLVAIILGIIFFVRYITKKIRKKETSIPEQENSFNTITYTYCAKCNIKNSAEARFCKGCGFEVSK